MRIYINDTFRPISSIVASLFGNLTISSDNAPLTQQLFKGYVEITEGLPEDNNTERKEKVGEKK